MRRWRAQRRVSAQTGDVTVSRVTLGDEQVRVSTIAGPSERAFLLVSGIGVASDYYLRLALDLQESGTVHTIDLPGFAGVPRKARRLGIEDFATLVEATIDELGLHDPVLIGHSMGSQVVTEVAARRSDISTIVLIGPVVDAQHRSVTQQAGRLLLCARREPFAITLHVTLSYAMCGPLWYFRVLPAMMRYPIEARLPSVAADVLILRGEHDLNSPREWVQELAHITPHARAWEIPDAAHSVMYAHAHEVARLSLEHLDGPAADRDRDQVRQRAEGPGGARNSPRRTFRYIARFLRGALSTLRGMALRNDSQVAEGTQDQIEALSEHRQPDAKDSGEPVTLTPRSEC